MKPPMNADERGCSRSQCTAEDAESTEDAKCCGPAVQAFAISALDADCAVHPPVVFYGPRSSAFLGGGAELTSTVPGSASPTDSPLPFACRCGIMRA